MGKEQKVLHDNRAEFVDKIITLSQTGEIVWDFTHFEDLDHGGLAIAEKENVLLISGVSQGSSIELSILLKEGENEIVELDNIKGDLAHKIRKYLEWLALSDKQDYQAIEFSTNGIIFAGSLLGD